MASELYKRSVAIAELNEKQAGLVSTMIHETFPVGEYPFAVRVMVSPLLEITIDLSNICRSREEFRLTLEMMSELLYRCTCIIVDSHIESANKREGTKQSYEVKENGKQSRT